jgi:hypothetical protein
LNPYLKGFFVGTSTLVLYVVLVPVMWLTGALLGGWLWSLMRLDAGPGAVSGGAYVGGSSFHVKSPIFLLGGVLIFIAGFYLEFHRLAVRQK